ncbi:ABC transporter ATP-binding protein [Aureimonas sp. SK2]|uniref:ABC transporter ATP-binding protein n=1 Tax=Aureimonas sp. SK2 TaxID=3015992 RepID=UPI002444094C|nr:ABC transporter ATP-binding protein [Aureimonas sp. SK2]
MAQTGTSERRSASAEGAGRTGVSFAADLEFRSVGFRAGRRAILSGIDLTVPAGRILCLLGPSGSGKTSLLRIASGIERQTEGQVFIGGEEVSGPGRFVPPEGRGVGLMFQDFALFPHMTLIDNVRYGLRALPKEQQRHTALSALRRVGLERLAESYPHNLSGGEQQRVAMARALVPRPQVLLMDEPFSGLDSRLRDEMRSETVAILRETRATAVIVTHDAEEAMRLGDRIALMREGRIVQYGTGRDLYRRPVDLFTAGFFSEINVLPGVVKAGRVVGPLGPVADSPRSNGTLVTVGLRLEGVRVSPDEGAVQARVLSRQFVGRADLLSLAVDGVDQRIKARIRPNDLPDGVHEVFVSVDPQEAFVFEESSGSA